MSVTVCGINIIVIIFPIFCSTVIRRVYVNTIHLFRVEVFKKLQRMEIVSFDQRMPQVAIGCIFYTVYRDKGRKNRLAKLRHSNERIKRTLALFACGFIDKVNYTIKCNTLGEQKEVHTEPW